ERRAGAGVGAPRARGLRPRVLGAACLSRPPGVLVSVHPAARDRRAGASAAGLRAAAGGPAVLVLLLESPRLLPVRPAVSGRMAAGGAADGSSRVMTVGESRMPGVNRTGGGSVRLGDTRREIRRAGGRTWRRPCTRTRSTTSSTRLTTR